MYRNNFASLSSWIFAPITLFAALVLFVIVADGILYFLAQGSLEFMAGRISKVAATAYIPVSEAGTTPKQLAQARCLAAQKEFEERGDFILFSGETRTDFLDKLSTVQDYTSGQDTGNGCYMEYNPGQSQLLILHIFIEAKQAWPILSSGLLHVLGIEKPIDMHGSASSNVGGISSTRDGYHPLDIAIDRSLDSYGIYISGFDAVPNTGQSAVQVGDIMTSQGEVLGANSLPNSQYQNSTLGNPVGLQQININNNNVNAPIILSSFIYRWNAKIQGCGVLQPNDWRSQPDEGFQWELNPNSFLDISQDTAMLLPCWNGQCESNPSQSPDDSNKIGRYAFKEDMPQFHLPIGVKKDEKFYARATNLDGNNGPIIVRNNNINGEEQSVKFLCAFNSLESLNQQQLGNDPTIASVDTLINSPQQQNGKRPRDINSKLIHNEPTRNCTLSHHIDAKGDTGPYKELGCDRPAENWDYIQKLHQTNQRYQNPIDRFLPYYKWAPTCPAGTPHCGYFGTMDNEASPANNNPLQNISSWYYGHSPEIIFNIQGRLKSNTHYTRSINRLDITCSYNRQSILQHCCNGITNRWCEENIKETEEIIIPGECECTVLNNTTGEEEELSGEIKWEVKPRQREKMAEFENAQYNQCCVAFPQKDTTLVIDECEAIENNPDYSDVSCDYKYKPYYANGNHRIHVEIPLNIKSDSLANCDATELDPDRCQL